MRKHVALIAVAATLCFAVQSQAAIWTFNNIILNGAQETPPVVTTGMGTATATLDDVTGTFIVSGSFSGLSGTTTNFHLHGPAAVGAPGNVIAGLPYDMGVTSGTFGGSTVLSAANIQNVLNELTYLNLHTSAHGTGELRGQLVDPVPEPTTALLLASGVGGLFLRRRRTR